MTVAVEGAEANIWFRHSHERGERKINDYFWLHPAEMRREAIRSMGQALATHRLASAMPTILRDGRWRFFFYSNEGSEPPHVHVESADGEAKYWLTPVALAGSSRMKPRAATVRCTDDELVVVLSDGRTLSVPLAWFPRLLRATSAERADWRLIGSGEGIRWGTLDEDLSVRGLLRGEPARR
jgi:hypothetical protein